MGNYELNQSGRRLQLFKTWGGVLLIVMLFGGPAYGQPANDECAGATVIPSNQPPPSFTNSVDTTTATSNVADPSLSCNGSGAQTDGNTVWYQWTPDANVDVNISTAGSTVAGGGSPLDTAHGVFTGACGALAEVACVDIGLTDDLFFQATGGVTYFLKFGEFLNGVGGGNLEVTVELPPGPEMLVLESVADGISPPINTLVVAPLAAAFSSSTAGISTVEGFSGQEVPMFMRDGGKGESSGENGGTPELLAGATAESNSIESLGAAGNQYFGNSANSATIDLLQSFDGAENDDNAFAFGFVLAPPDTDGDVGPNHYVQMTNLNTEIFDKSGSTVLGPFPNNVFWTGLGGLCEFTNQGDPIVIYDEETDRWLVSQFGFVSSGVPPWSLCIAVSQTSDPTGAYFQHEFDFSGVGFPDYPKYGFVTDAIGVMANLFSPFQGAGLGAIDKAEAMTAGATTMVFFKLGTSEFGFVTGDNDGPVFNNMPPTFFTNNGGSGDRIDVWEIAPDFAVPANSTISEVASIPVSPFDSDICGAFRERCIDQPGSGTGTPPNNITFLEAIADRLMHRLQLRDFGRGRQRAMVSHTVDADGNGTAGVRWYEFRNHGRGWQLHQEDTFSPDGDHRWMGSVAMNASGNTCLGYSISSTTTHPSIGVVGRMGRDHTNVSELVVFNGNDAGNVQTQTSRWGDYSAMAIDPVDDTCWYTQEFAKPGSFIGERFGWATKIIQFDLKPGKGNN